MLLKRLWQDDRGMLASTDLILIGVIVGMGMIVGLTTFRDQVVQEFGDLATAVGRLNQSYEYTGCGEEGETRHWVAGSNYTDEPDFCEAEDVAGQAPAMISLEVGPEDEGSGGVAGGQ